MSALDVAAGAAFIVLASAAWVRPGRAAARTTGALAGLVAITWFAGGVLPEAVLWHRGPLVHLVLLYPAVHPRPRGTRLPVVAVVVAAYAGSAVPSLAAAPGWSVTLAALLLGAAWWRWRRTARLVRRRAGVVAAAGLAVALVAPVVLRGGGGSTDTALTVYLAAVGAVAVVLTGDVLVGRVDDSALAYLVVDLGDVADRATLRARVARALGDPGVTMAFETPDGTFTDHAGTPVRPATDGRAVTRLDAGGTSALLLHDPAVRLGPELRAAVARATTTALRNIDLQETVREQADAVARSRLRLLVAEDAAREQFGRELRDGPRRRLDRVRALVANDWPDLAAAIDRTDADLARLGAGLLPSAGDESLPGAVTGLAVGLGFSAPRVTAVEGLPGPVRAGVWFVCAEALTNAAKHAQATAVDVAVRVVGADVVVEVHDDGRGGAAPAGPGLRGLATRVEALGGRLQVDSTPGQGTTVRARMPLATRPLTPASAR